jgi:hypothetical protein
MQFTRRVGDRQLSRVLSIEPVEIKEDTNSELPETNELR